MEMADEKITIGLALVLDEIVNSLLTVEGTDKDGKKIIADRNLPFRLRYRLTRNKLALDRDVQLFGDKKILLLAKYGTPNEEGTEVLIRTKENYDKYNAELSAIFSSPVTHNIITVEKEDLDAITDEVPISTDALKLFIGYMSNDPDLYKDLLQEIKYTAPEFKEEPKKEVKVEKKTTKPATKVTPATKASTKTTSKTTTTKKTRTKKTIEK